MLDFEDARVLDCVPRSEFYNIEPKGIGTPFVESLTSYLARLSQCHGVLTGTLVNQVLAPRLNKEYLTRATKNGGCRFYERSSCLNGTSATTHEVKDLIESLNGRTDLSCLTLLNWSRFLATRGLHRKRRVWCPDCFNHFLNDLRDVYEPLIWSIQTVKICPIHKTVLEQRCANCGRDSPPLTRKARVGHCFHCHSWLGGSKNHKTNQTDFEAFCIEQVMHVMKWLQFESPVLDMPAILSDLTSFGRLELGTLASQIGFSKVTLWEWQKGITKPSLNNLLKFCYKLSLSVEDLVNLSWASVNIKIDCDLGKERVTRRTRSIDWDFVRRQLENILNDSADILSMEQVAKCLGYNKRLLYKHWPTHCKSISKKYINKLTDSRKRNIQIARSGVRALGQSLISSGTYPSQRRIKYLSSQPGILRSTYEKQEWADLLKTWLMNGTNQRS